MKQTLHDFAANPDGKTYDGRKAIRWLFEAMTGKPMSEAEAQQIADDAQRRAADRRR